MKKTRSVGQFGALLREAMDRKARDLGSYSLRDLERETGVNYAYASRVVRGERTPRQEIVVSLSRGMGQQYLPLDAAMLAAGYLPTDERKASALQRLGQLPAAALERLGALGTEVRVTLDEPADCHTEDDAEGERTECAPAEPTGYRH